MDEKEEVLKSIRESLLFFGVDTSHLTDQELEDGIMESGKAMSQAGYTIDEMLQGVSEFSKI